jgi:hypothetical protein
VINQFEELLHALGKVFHLPLHVDRMNACSLRVHNELVIQLQLDVAQENLWIFSKLTEIPPGKFRENVLRECLKANGLKDPRAAILGYIANTNHLALFQKYPLNILNGERLSGLIGAFLQMADSWRTAIASGQTAPPVKK